MNPTIVKIIDLMFRGIPETEETAAIREELLTNSQARYDDLLAAGESPNTALGQVLDSLRGMEEVLDEYRSQQSCAEPAQPGDPFADLRRKAAHIGSQWEQTAEQVESKLESAADQLESKWDTLTDKAENVARTAWDSAMKGFRSAMDSVSGLFEEQSAQKGDAMPVAGEEQNGMVTYSFSPEEVRYIHVQLIGEDMEVTPSNDGRIHVLLNKEDERLFHVESKNGTLSLRRDPQAARPDEDDDEENDGLTNLIAGIGKTLGRVLNFARICGDTVRLMLPDQLEQINLQTASGDVEVTGLRQKNLSLFTTSGDVELSGCTADSVHIHTTSGDLDASGCTFTKVQLNSTSGDMEMNIHADQVTANTTNGDLELSGQLGWLKLNTVNGDVNVEVEGPGFEGTITNTVSGDVSFILPLDVIPCVETATVSGGVSITCHDRNSAIPLRINTVSGDISVDNF